MNEQYNYCPRTIIEHAAGMRQDWNSPEKDSPVFYRDMRFWLILAMLSAFLVFILIQYPG